MGASLTEIAYENVMMNTLALEKQRTSCLFLVHGRNDGHEKIFAFVKVSLNLTTDVTLWNFNIVLRVAVWIHQIQETVVDVDLVLYFNIVAEFSLKTKGSRAGIPDGGRWAHPYCEWMEIYLPVSSS